MDRRAFVRAMLGGAASLALPPLASASAASTDPFYAGPRSLDLRRGGEHATVCYWRDGQYLPEGYAKICWLLRDVRAEQYVQIDPMLLELLRWIQHYAGMHGYKGAIEVLSGYRTAETNTRAGGAANSQHLHGKAVDFVLPGVTPASLADVVKYLGVGGAGVYVRKGYVHADTGPLRGWQG